METRTQSQVTDIQVAMSSMAIKDTEVQTPAAKRKGFPLPNELIDKIIEFLPLTTRTLLTLGRTCHQLRNIINENSDYMSGLIIERERTRLDTVSRCKRTGRLVGPGLSLLQILRRFCLDEGRRCGCVVNRMRSLAEECGHYEIHDKPWRAAALRTFREKMFRYLWYLNLTAHPAHECNGRDVCWKGSCDPRSTLEPRDIEVVDAVQRFTENSWSMDLPLDFYKTHAISTDALTVANQDAWLSMVRSVLDEPIQQFTRLEEHLGTAIISETLHDAMYSEGPLDPRRTHGLQRLMMLVTPREHETPKFLPKLTSRLIRHTESCYETRTLHKLFTLTRGVRALKEYGACLRAERKLLDPDSKLLLAAIYEELLAVG